MWGLTFIRNCSKLIFRFREKKFIHPELQGNVVLVKPITNNEYGRFGGNSLDRYAIGRQ